MKRLIVIAALLLASCANPSVVTIDHQARAGITITRVYVPRFEGSPEFVEESTDMFVAELRARDPSADIVQGDALRSEGADVMAGGNLASTDAAIAQAKRAGAQVVIMGKVTSYDAHGALNGFSTVRVVDVQSGRSLASIHRPSGLLIGNMHQAVLAAVKRSADDVASALR